MTPSHEPHPGGRPPLFTLQADLQAKIDGYFDQFKGSEVDGHAKKGKAPNVFGLCLHIGMSYDAFIDYENGDQDHENEEFSVSCKNARLKVLEYAGENAYSHTAGSVFNTVNNTRKFKEPWKNAQHQEIAGDKSAPLTIQITQNQAGIL